MSETQEKLNLQLLNVIKSKSKDFETKLKKVKYLIRLGADVNAKFYGKSILSWAVIDGNIEPSIISFLKEKGAEEWEISYKEALELKKEFWDENGKLKSVEEIKKLIKKGGNLGEIHLSYKIWRNLRLSEANEILKELPSGYKIDGDVDLQGMGLYELPDFSKVNVSGNFYCNKNNLNSLEGAPYFVGLDFFCNENKLIDLKGAPKQVLGSFCCGDNELYSLEGSPFIVGENFMCDKNKLTSLKEAPVKVGGAFICSSNNLLSLEGAPSKICGNFDCAHNKLETLFGAPSEVWGDFDCRDNNLLPLKREDECDRYVANFDFEIVMSASQRVKGELLIEKDVLCRIKRSAQKGKLNFFRKWTR